MSVRITDNTPQIKSMFSIKASIFLRRMADQIVKISTPKTPKKTGDLRRGVVKQVLGLKGTIKWGKNYAVHQETKKFRNYTTPGTGPNFAVDAVKKGANKTSAVARSVGLI